MSISVGSKYVKGYQKRGTAGNQKEGNGKYPQRFALSEQVCDLHPEFFIMKWLVIRM